MLGVVREAEGLRQKYAPEDDPRLQKPPFSDHCVQYIVHRHVLRVSQSFHNIMRTSRQLGGRVYLTLATDTVKPADAAAFIDGLRREVLQIPQPRVTHHLPGCSLWLFGMKLLLYSKKCARLGLMNGCTCTLVDIIFSEHERLPGHVEVGDVVPLQYMPVALLLRADGAKWVLPPSKLPENLPPDVDWKGLFLLAPEEAYFKYDNIEVKRVHFPICDASVRIVYSAQGEEYEACIIDMAKPHQMSDEVFYLASYVMISRAKSLEGLLITRLCEKSALEKGAPQYLLDEVNRLLGLERQSQTALKKYLQKVFTTLPSEILALFDGKDTVPHATAHTLSSNQSAATSKSSPMVRTLSSSQPDGASQPEPFTCSQPTGKARSRGI